MATQLDVYKDWLGIPDPQRPLNYYQLLRLPAFEDDPAKIRAHYRKLNAHVRKYAAGDYAKQSQDLLNELAKAMLCLTDRKRKGEYDASIGRKDAGKERKFTFEQLLLGRKVVSQEQLTKARDYADSIGLEVRDALVQQKMASQDVVMQIYAESLGLPYVDIADVGIREDLVDDVPAVLARQYSCAPIMLDRGQVLMASPNPLPPEVEDELRLRLGKPVRSVLCTAAGINAVINEHFPREAAAAQMAAGPVKAAATPSNPKAAAKAAAKAEKASAKAKAAASSEPLSPEEIAEAKKQRTLLTIVGFNFSFMVVAMVTQAMSLGMKGLGLAAIVASIVASIVYMVKK